MKPMTAKEWVEACETFGFDGLTGERVAEALRQREKLLLSKEEQPQGGFMCCPNCHGYGFQCLNCRTIL